MGHFLCLDRWGRPSDEEKKNGMPFHGEASRVMWDILTPPTPGQRGTLAEMGATLPLAGIKIKRRIVLSANEPLFLVREEVTNTNKLGRVFNMVQHPTIGPPFLDEQTVVDSNARRGFMQDSPLPNPEALIVTWPEARHDGKPVDLRHLTTVHDPNVVSFTIDDEYGWVTAANPARGLLIGYIWKRTEYPWFNVWRHVENGKPFARGLEFGTTGLHQPFPVLVAKGRIFDRPLYEYMDANATVSKSYACFLFAIPKNYAGVASVGYENGRLKVRARNGGRELSAEVGEGF